MKDAPEKSHSRPEYYKSGFDTDAVSSYDLLVNIATFFQMKRYRRSAVKMLDLRQGQSVIDYACGTGEFSILAAQEVGENGKVRGIDLSDRMLKIAMKKSRKYPQISYRKQNFEERQKEKYDAATIGIAAHEVPQDARHNLYRSAHDSLKRGGKLLIMDYTTPKKVWLSSIYRFYLKTAESPYGMQYVIEDHEQILRKIGFTKIKERTYFVFDACIYKKK